MNLPFLSRGPLDGGAPRSDDRCRRHDLPMQSLAGPLTLADVGFHGPCGEVQVTGLPARRCPRCAMEGRPASVSPEWREWLRALASAPASGVAGPLHVDLGAPAHETPTGGAPEAGATGPWSPRPPRHGLDAVVLSRETEARLEELLAAVRYAEALARWGHEAGPWPKILLCGPSGTGKNTLSEGLAHELGRPVLLASPASVQSSLVGETARNIEALFAAAQAAGAVLFFDEADPLVSARLESPRSSADNGLNLSRVTFFRCLDEVETPVVLATNLPRLSDPALRRRLRAVLPMGLPDEGARRRLLDRFLPAATPLAEPRDHVLDLLCAESEGLAGGHLRKAMEAAAVRALVRTEGLGPVALTDLREGLARVRSDEAALSEATPAQPRVSIEELVEDGLSADSDPSAT